MADRYEVASLEPRELVPGHHGRFIHTEHTTQVYWQIEAGALLPEHSHPAEQIAHVLEGTYELTVDGEHFLLNEGDVLAIPGGALHSGVAHTDCRIIDVFSPVREEYR